MEEIIDPGFIDPGFIDPGFIDPELSAPKRMWSELALLKSSATCKKL